MMDDREPISFASKEDASAEQARWARMLPNTPSAYRPSGKISLPGCALLLTLGVGTGALAAAIAGSIVAIVGGLVTSISLHMGAFTVVTFPISALATLLGLFVATGLGALAVGSRFTQRTRNRNVHLGGAVGLLSGVAGAFVLSRIVLPGVAEFLVPLLPDLPKTIFVTGAGMTPVMITWAHETLQSASNSGTVTWIAFFLCAAIGGIWAMVGSMGVVQGMKFCESCKQVMDARLLALLSLDGVKSLVHAMQDRAPAKGDVPGFDGAGPTTVHIYECPVCGAGYVEATLNFLARWPTPNKKDKYDKMSKSWTVSSRAVAKSDIELLERGS